MDPDMKRALIRLGHSHTWPAWPWLAVVRRGDGDPEVGVMADLFRCKGITGYSATVFKKNILFAPTLVGELLKLDKEVFDNAEEVYAAGWRPDEGL